MGSVILAMLFISLYFSIGIVVTWFVVQVNVVQVNVEDKYKSTVYFIAVLIWPVVVFTLLLTFIVVLVLRTIGKNKKS